MVVDEGDKDELMEVWKWEWMRDVMMMARE